MYLKSLLTFVLSVLFVSMWAQSIIPRNDVRSPEHTIYAFTNSHIVISPGQEIENGVLVIQDGRVLASGKDVTIPHNAVVYNLNGKYIYPSFIELYSNYGMPEVAKRKNTSRPEFVSKNNGSTYWNDAIHPQLETLPLFKQDAKKAKELRAMGFGSVLSHQFNGIMRGDALLVGLGNNKNGKALIKPRAASYFGFGKGNSVQSYPTSLMGSIALFRQAMHDGSWYSSQENVPTNYSLEAITTNASLPAIFDAKNYQNVLRAAALGKEFNIPMIAIAGGDEYKRISLIKEAQTRLILPLKFPEPYDVSDPLDAEYISLEDMKHWELAPSNPAIMNEAEIPFALSATADPKMFWKNLRLAIQYGLSPQNALAALTVTPAQFLQMDQDMGTLEAGKLANFFISDADVLVGDGRVLENWTQGERHIITNAMAVNPTGKYNMNFGGVLYDLNIIEIPKGFAISTTMGGTKEAPQKGSITIENDLLTIRFQKGNHQHSGPIRMVGKVNFKGKIIDGKGQDADGNWADWTAIKQKSISLKTYGDSVKTLTQNGHVFYPNMAFGDTALPVAEKYFIKNVMIWTSDSLGKFRGSVAIANGRIEEVSKLISTPEGYIGIDGTGLHLTPGIIDEHSHISISKGVNEGGQNNSAEVRIGDVLNPEDINMYRQLSGGVTSAQLLHGSVNPIGGQAQIIKLRWGQGPEELKFPTFSKSIKFALGENVKQSNAGRRNTVRFPQTRMGVEQVYIDAFTRAKKYQQEWKLYNEATNKELRQGLTPPRRDLELDALVEILNGQRHITCHSYIQSEITMLINLADSLGFHINTFTHVLEGYKIADKLKEHGAYASTFSDWWAYKYEVNDAIPYNAAILSEQGVVTAINSDDAEMGRRLNQEAAKTVKYGGVSEIEAVKMITINPAKMLHIDDEVGSIIEGKSADLVLWSGHPLSIYSHPKMVMIDGAIYYSTEKNTALLAQIKAERQRLILAMLKAKKSGSKTQKVKPKTPHAYHCDSFEEEVNH